MHTPPPDFDPDRYRGQLLRLVRSQWNNVLQGWGNPSDLVQEVLLQAYENRAAFRNETPLALGAWLRKILASTLADVIRYRRRKKRDCQRVQPIAAAGADSDSPQGEPVAHSDPSPSSLAETLEQLKHLVDALVQLPLDQMEAVTLHHLQGLPLEATATQMERTRAAVAGLLRRGLKRLKQLMTERGAADEQ